MFRGCARDTADHVPRGREGANRTDLSPLAMKEEIKKEIEKKAKDGRLPCATARKIAQDLSVPYREVGKAADELQIKITNCELGCF